MFKKQILFSVTTFKMSQQILVGAKCDHDLSLRVSGVNDLIVAEGKYHSGTGTEHIMYLASVKYKQYLTQGIEHYVEKIFTSLHFHDSFLIYLL